MKAGGQPAKWWYCTHWSWVSFDKSNPKVFEKAIYIFKWIELRRLKKKKEGGKVVGYSLVLALKLPALSGYSVVKNATHRNWSTTRCWPRWKNRFNPVYVYFRIKCHIKFCVHLQKKTLSYKSRCCTRLMISHSPYFF